MERALKLSMKGTGHVSPNPLVGAVLVRHGRMIGEGFHERYGGPHAEVNAIEHSVSRGKSISGATLYVNLEPCSHHGKTPPCVDAIIRHGIRHVVIATADPNPLVSGRGIKKLKEHGITVKTGLLKKEAQDMNRSFLKFIAAGVPFFALKAAQTSDGFIAHENGSSKWITNALSRRFVHRLRSEYDAVLTGAGTVMADDPELTVRSVRGRDPLRIVIDGNFSLPVDRKVFSNAPRTLLYVSEESFVRERTKGTELTKRNVSVIPMPARKGKIDLHSIALDIAKKNIASVLVEGGQKIYTEFLNAGLADELYLFTAHKYFHSGIKTFGKLSVSYRKRRISERMFGTDRLQHYRLSYP